MSCPEWIVGVAWLSLILCLGWPRVFRELHRGYISFSASVLRTRLSSERDFRVLQARSRSAYLRYAPAW